MNDKDTPALITQECDRIKVLLLEKNRHYGDSAFHPVKVFSQASVTERLRDRADDKIKRIMQGNPDDPEMQDSIDDLIGYLILLNIANGVTAHKHVYRGPMTITELAESREGQAVG